MRVGGVVGVLGGGQLGRMLALAGAPLGLRFRFLDPDPEAPAGRVGELIVGRWDDPSAIERVARGADVVTFEFENVPAATLQAAARFAPVHPGAASLATAQDRWLEKRCFAKVGLEIQRVELAGSELEIRRACGLIGLPAVVKRRQLGYDGKGQCVVRTEADIPRAWALLGREAEGGQPLIVEEFVAFDREVSAIGVRSAGGEVAVYPVVENVHREGILRRSTAPAPVRSADDLAADRLARKGITRVLEELGHVGVLAVEFFQVGGRLIANEMAPRVHNSGHWTIEGARTSQFENHVRAVVGLPIGDASPVGHSVMLNIIGASPDVSVLAAEELACVHMYDKSPRAGRKIGHVTAWDGDEARVRASAERLERIIGAV